ESHCTGVSAMTRLLKWFLGDPEDFINGKSRARRQLLAPHVPAQKTRRFVNLRAILRMGNVEPLDPAAKLFSRTVDRPASMQSQPPWRLCEIHPTFLSPCREANRPSFPTPAARTASFCTVVRCDGDIQSKSVRQPIPAVPRV